jgi:hypothetical protein
MTTRRVLNGALAGGIAAAVWAAQQPLDKRVFGSNYDDVELLGKFVTRGPGWHPAGLALHLQNGVLFGAAYAGVRPFLPGPPVALAVGAAMAEHFGGWAGVGYVDRFHPARGELVPLKGNRRALAQATWRHLLFGAVMGVIEARLNDRSDEEPPPAVPVESNGHGNIEAAAGVVSVSS